MKVGSENRNKTIVAAVLGVIAIILVWRNFFTSGPVIASPPPPAATIATAANSGRPARRLTGPRRGTQPAAVSANPLDPRLRLDLLKTSEETEYKGAGRNIFLAQAEPPIPTPLDNGITDPGKHANITPTPLPEPGPPPPPPINLKYFGNATSAGGPRQAFLLQDGDVFVAKEGDIVDRRYKVTKITPTSVEVEDLLSNNRQTIPLSAGG